MERRSGGYGAVAGSVGGSVQRTRAE
jgi:hypothetical protein